MLSKFISVSETRFQNTETALKNQQASIQGLETQIGQLSKLISERPQGSLPSNTEPNPRDQFNAINVQDEEGVVEPDPEPRQETMKEVHEPFSSNSGGPIHDDRRLQIEELDEWRTHKSRTPDKLNLRQNKLNIIPNQLKVGDKVLLDAVDPHIVTTTANEEIPLTVLSIFPFGTVEVSHPKFGTFKGALVPGGATYNPSRSRASALPPSLRYLHAILAYTITGRFLSIVAQESSLTIIGQMSPQGISSMLSMRMIERGQGTYPPQYRPAQSIEEEAYKDIPDDVPPQHEDPPTQPPHPLVQFMRRLHMLTSLSASVDSSSSVFNDLTTLMLLYSRFVSTSTSHHQSHLANHPAMKMTYGLMNLYDRRSILLHSRTDYSPKLQFEEFIIQ
ncbi:hypothetical protein GOBAR_AA25045 [Gossypium barbadense]|uniref:Uncharacterized protein n=1 Tax=Gossypium barbadense TaxID=3634 RepID=A0A2P5WX18_GOSBA|nr:hypothetical protein GOBAR_AA25045 [Gossypium barbadense]